MFWHIPGHICFILFSYFCENLVFRLVHTDNLYNPRNHWDFDAMEVGAFGIKNASGTKKRTQAGVKKICGPHRWWVFGGSIKSRTDFGFKGVRVVFCIGKQISIKTACTVCCFFAKNSACCFCLKTISSPLQN